MSLEPSPSLPTVTGGHLTTLRIIVASLAIGVASFAAVAIAQNAGQPHTFAANFDAMGIAILAWSVAALPLGIVVPRIVLTANRSSASLPPLPGATPEETLLATVQQRVFTTTIIGCAIYEGAAFASILGYMLSREVVHLGVAGVLMTGILANFPWAASYQRRMLSAGWSAALDLYKQ